MCKRRFPVWLLSATMLLSFCATSKAQDDYKQRVLALSKRIDEQIEAKWKDAGLKPASKAEDGVYFRRLSLDITGKIPNLTDGRDFLDDTDPDKRWHWVERMLGGEMYARNFAAFWRFQILGANNNQQFAFAAPGFEIWLRDKLQKNDGYNRIVHELLTFGAGNPQMAFGGGPQSNPQAFYLVNENKAENLAASTTRIFLGVKLECAQCHAHPFAKWTREQFWETAAFFAGSEQPVRRPGLQAAKAVDPNRREIKIPGTNDIVKAKFLTGEEPNWKPNVSPRTVLADWLTSVENVYFAKATVDHLWSYFFGVSLLEPILEPSDDSPVTHPELLEMMARVFADEKFDLKFLVRAIVHTQAYQRASHGDPNATKDDYSFFTRMPVRGLTPEQLFDSVAEATAYSQPSQNPNMGFQQFGPPQSPRAQFLTKFTTQDRRHESQTSILQALFLMNGKFLAERVKTENNPDFNTLVNQKTSTAMKVDSLYLWVLGRLPRAEERNRLVLFVDAGGAVADPRRALSDVYWALLNSPEFMLNH
ncbi:MAG: DUF1549 and DUF1553 domain-containing protein [Gemmataceae bacterium]|nr:DUF1549 and DUF1553 domain-containing protein [Gemmataceae bacterium]